MFRAKIFQLFSNCRTLSKSGFLLQSILTIPQQLKMSTGNSPLTIGTHSGIFHCDEVLACFLLRQLPQFSDAKIVRSRDENDLKQCEIVVDVGGVFDKNKNLFDHHQKSFNETFSSLRPEFPNYNIRLSSAGLIYTYFGEEVIQKILKDKCDLKVDSKLLKTIFEKVYRGLIQEIDGIDNGVPMFEGEPAYQISTDLSSRIGRLNSVWNDTGSFDVQSQFEKAIVVVGEEFIDRVTYYGSVWHPARSIVQDAIENRYNVHSSGEIIFLSQICPWKDHLCDLETENGLDGVLKYVLFCSSATDYRVNCVPINPKSFVCRKFLHKEWRGVRDADLAKISGIKGAIFVHATGFIGGCKTREGALEMAIKSLNADGESL
ncbi:MYG1 protein [Pseudolycoriella hygida]|uniref:MYG1 protein n=1 Tax=Pseudolycoriella hygida TaxID=35572 RepID=A0A9Q0RWB7_9DIPT|nr:MYG1 protein [Pseudolycoriella hygida]